MTTEVIDHPPHYTKGGVEAIDVIEAWELGFRLGNVIKYIARAEAKDNALMNLKKARWYLDREIEKREASKEDRIRDSQDLATLQRDAKNNAEDDAARYKHEELAAICQMGGRLLGVTMIQKPEVFDLIKKAASKPESLSSEQVKQLRELHAQYLIAR